MSKDTTLRNIALWDSNLDKKLTKAEVINCIKASGVGLIDAEEDEIDKSLKAETSWEECMALLEKYRAKKGEDWLAKNLALFDHRKIGSVSTEEFQAALENVGNILNQEQRQSLIALIDDKGRVNIDNLVKIFNH